MEKRTALGAADVDDDVLAEMVAAQLGVGRVELLTAVAEVAPYDLEALTTAGRFWVHGKAGCGDTTMPYRFFVKVVQSWERSPYFAFVPTELREVAIASVPWRREPDVYASDLGDRLPAGLSMPAARGVVELDQLSAAIWLDAVEAVPVRWDARRFTHAAYLMGRLAASADVAPLSAIGDIDNVPRTYAAGRLTQQVLPALHDEDLWSHPVMTAAFDNRLRDDLRTAAGRVPAMLDELDLVPLATFHGDACTRNLLVRRGAEEDGFVLIDFGFWGRGPVGFDLSQLLLGEVQTGERDADELPALEAACVDDYVRGLADEGLDLPVEVVRRSHALLMLEFSGLSAIPFELLDGPPSPEAVRIARERAVAARFILDLVDATTPLR